MGVPRPYSNFVRVHHQQQTQHTILSTCCGWFQCSYPKNQVPTKKNIEFMWLLYFTYMKTVDFHGLKSWIGSFSYTSRLFQIPMGSVCWEVISPVELHGRLGVQIVDSRYTQYTVFDACVFVGINFQKQFQVSWNQRNISHVSCLFVVCLLWIFNVCIYHITMSWYVSCCVWLNLSLQVLLLSHIEWGCPPGN